MRSLWGMLVAGCLGTCAISPGQSANSNSEIGLAHGSGSTLHDLRPSDGEAWWELAMQYQAVSRYRDAERAYGEALRLLKKDQPIFLAATMDDLGTMYVEMGRFDKAERLERNALALREAQNDATGVGISWMHLSMVSMGQHHVADAAMFAELAVNRLVQRGEAATAEQKIAALIYLSHVRSAQADWADAIRNLKISRGIAEKSYRQGNSFRAYIDFLIGRAHWKIGDLELADQEMRTGTAGMQAELGWGHPTYVKALKEYEIFLQQTHRVHEAAEVQRTITEMKGARSGSAIRQGQAMTVLPQ